MNKGWKTISSKIVHKNPYFQVRKNDVINPNNNPGKYFIIEGTDSVAIIAKNNKEEIYLVGQTRYPIGNVYSLEIVAGSIALGTTPLQSAKKELEEETGIKAKKWTSLGYFFPSVGNSPRKCHLFLAQNLNFGNQSLEDCEDIIVKKLSIEQIIKLIKTNKISDAKSITAILKYLLLKGK